MRRHQLTKTQIVALFDPPTEPRELIRHYTLSAGDLAIVQVLDQPRVRAFVGYSNGASRARRGGTTDQRRTLSDLAVRRTVRVDRR